MSLDGNGDRSVMLWGYVDGLCYGYSVYSGLHVFCVTEDFSLVPDVAPFLFIPIIRYSVLSLEIYTQYDICHQ